MEVRGKPDQRHVSDTVRYLMVFVNVQNLIGVDEVVSVSFTELLA